MPSVAADLIGEDEAEEGRLGNARRLAPRANGREVLLIASAIQKRRSGEIIPITSEEATACTKFDIDLSRYHRIGPKMTRYEMEEIERDISRKTYPVNMNKPVRYSRLGSNLEHTTRPPMGVLMSKGDTTDGRKVEHQCKCGQIIRGGAGFHRHIKACKIGNGEVKLPEYDLADSGQPSAASQEFRDHYTDKADEEISRTDALKQAVESVKDLNLERTDLPEKRVEHFDLKLTGLGQRLRALFLGRVRVTVEVVSR